MTKEDKIFISRECLPIMYNCDDDLTEFIIGHEVSVTFTDKKVGVPKDYRGKTINFIVNNILPYFRGSESTRKLALVPSEKINEFNLSDVILVDDAQSFRILMVALRNKNNKIPFRGWKNKKLKIKKVK